MGRGPDDGKLSARRFVRLVVALEWVPWRALSVEYNAGGGGASPGQIRGHVQRGPKSRRSSWPPSRYPWGGGQLKEPAACHQNRQQSLTLSFGRGLERGSPWPAASAEVRTSRVCRAIFSQDGGRSTASEPTAIPPGRRRTGWGHTPGGRNGEGRVWTPPPAHLGVGDGDRPTASGFRGFPRSPGGGGGNGHS